MASGVPAEAAAMKCVVCRQGETRPGKTTMVLQRGGATMVINDVPARVCENCGEEYVDEQVAENVLAAAEASARAGVRVEIRDYVAA
jgi:YgiT-type zinc finger domain-containing protein